MMETILYVIRHAQSSQEKEKFSEYERPLTIEGLQQAKDIISQLLELKIEKIYSSPYKRALDTIKPFAMKTGLEINKVEDFREIKLQPVGKQFMKIKEKTFSDLNFKLPNCESGLECQERFYNKILSLLPEIKGKVIIPYSPTKRELIQAIGMTLSKSETKKGLI